MGFKTTNVVLPNGDADPWHALGILERTADMDESVVPIVINGTFTNTVHRIGASIQFQVSNGSKVTTVIIRNLPLR